MIVDISCNMSDALLINDIDDVISKCKIHHTMPIFVGIDYDSSKTVMSLAEKNNTLCYVGIHPLHSSNVKGDIRELLKQNSDHVVGIGECGLDYYRLQYSDKETQKKVFIEQLNLNGPRYFLHCRDSHRDFMDTLDDYNVQAVVHSFTGTVGEAMELVKKGYYIGINGCSLKHEMGVDVVSNLPLDRILIESDSPYCTIRKSYAGYKYIDTMFNETKKSKKRNEPFRTIQVAQCIANIKKESIQHVICKLEQNSLSFFGSQFEKYKTYWE